MSALSLARRVPFEVVASIVLALVACVVEIAAVPGIESAAAFGVLLPPFVAAATAHRTARARRAGTHSATRSVLTALVVPSVAFAGVLAVSLARQLTDPACFTWDGVPWLVFGPWPGMVLAGLVGELVGRGTERPRVAATLGVLVVIGSYGVVLREIWSTPAVYVFTLFAGHWPGPIYDEATAFPAAFVSYRAVTLLAVGALALPLAMRGREGALARACRGLAAVLGVAFVVLTAAGDRFGHRTTIARIDRELGARVVGARCVLHVPSEMPRRERTRTLTECETHVRDVERALRVHRRAPLHAFVYRSASEKGALVGASDTYVAKPWRGEVHVQREPFPHTVLRHEIVHVIAAEIGPWPFRAAGGLGGLASNPQLVEGLAVALAPESRDGLTTDQWSRAMLELHHLPSAGSLAGAGFLGQGPSASYAASGSFIAHVLRLRGPRAMHRMYREASVGDGAALARYERSWHAYLRTVPLPPEALGLARQRLEDRGLFSTRCARLRARVIERMGRETERGDHVRALRSCRELLAIDRRDAYARVANVLALARAGRVLAADARLARLARDATVPAPLVARAHAVLADRWLVSSAPDRESHARAHYRASLAIPQSDDASRSVEVRLSALDRPRAERDAIVAAVCERDDVVPEALVALTLERVRTSSVDGLPTYLLARRLANANRQRESIELFRDAERRGLASTRLRRENGRMLVVALLASAYERSGARGALDEARTRLGAIATDPSARAMVEPLEPLARAR